MQSNSAVAASVIGLGLANQIATDQGQASVLADVAAALDAAAEVKVAEDAFQIP